MPDPWRKERLSLGGTPVPVPPTNGYAAPLLGEDAARERRYAVGALRSAAAEMAATSVGRNDAFNTHVFKLAGYVNAGTLTEAEVIEVMTDAGRAASVLGDHPYTDEEMTATFRSAFGGASAKGVIKSAPEDSVTVVAPGALGTVIPINGHARAHPQEALVTVLPALIAAEVDESYWTARESLRTIYAASLARMTAPWAVMAHCVARVLALTCPRVELPPIIGGPGSLNFFAVVTAVSGGGKGAASAAARVLVPLDGVPQPNLGSGEGMITAYQTTASDEWPEGLRESVMFIGDEIDTIAALGARTGSTTMAVLRSGFSGETLGFSYATKGRDVHLKAGTYRMTLVLSVQPRRAGALLDDHRGGTPQRFMWFPGVDHRVVATTNQVHADYQLPIPNFIELGRSREIQVPEVARATIVDNRVKAMRGDTEVLDGHALFCREKFAFALALLDGRMTMTEEDWQLSGIAAEVSDRTRAYVLDQMGDAAAEDASERGRLMGISSLASDEEKNRAAHERQGRVARWILDKLAEAGPEGITRRDLNHKMASRDRGWLDHVLAALTADQLIDRDDEGRWRKR